MELTISKVIFTKEVPGNFGPQHNVRFTTNEHGEQSISGFFGKPLKHGQVLNGEIIKKPGTDKNGNEVVYWNFQEAKKTQAPSGEVMIKLDKIYQEAFAARQEIVMLRQLLQEKGTLPVMKDVTGPVYAPGTQGVGRPMPATLSDDEFAPPLEAYPDEINPEDIPF